MLFDIEFNRWKDGSIETC